MASSNERPTYWITRSLFTRGMGFVYFIGFLVALNQWKPLLGSGGLMPMPLFFEAAKNAIGRRAYLEVPTLLWLRPTDGFVMACSWVGLALSALVVLGLSNAAVMAVLWLLYGSLVHAGQLFYGYGWEMMMIEAGFLAIFLYPWRNWRPMPIDSPPPEPVIWLLRWMLFRLMFGAGLIKIRGDSCWRDLTCLYYHFETQPIPNPLSWYLHNLPKPFLQFGVLFNHLAELVAPFFAFAPRPWRTAAGLVMIGFQLVLIFSGNLSWLNYFTVIIAFSCFDDRFWARWLPVKLEIPQARWSWKLSRASAPVYALTGLVALLSIQPTLNLLSAGQVMNGSFEPIGLVNTYGAFGSVGKERLQLVLEGTLDDDATETARWREYPFKCSPGDVRRRPCVVSPYQERLDWQVWFAAMEEPGQNAWLFHLVLKLLQGDRAALGLFAADPFDGHAPKSIRAILYRYRFTKPSDHTRDWWTRERMGVYLPPLALDNPYLLPLIRSAGLER